METPRAVFKRERLDSFSDGIFAFAMTLLIAEVDVPRRLAGTTSAELGEALAARWPQFVHFALAFLSLGCLWVGFRLVLHGLAWMDRAFLFKNLLLLMGVAAVPFLTALMGEYPDLALPAAAYGLHFGLLVFGLFLLWSYATRGRRLVLADLPDETVRSLSRRLLLAAALYSGAGGLAFLNPWLSVVIYFVLPLLFAVPGALGRGLVGFAAPETAISPRDDRSEAP